MRSAQPQTAGVLAEGVALTNPKEERAGEDGRAQSCAGDEHRQHAGAEYQLLCEWRDDLVAEPAHIGQTEHPEVGVWGGGAGAMLPTAHPSWALQQRGCSTSSDIKRGHI